jgi:hypothetical protein
MPNRVRSASTVASNFIEIWRLWLSHTRRDDNLPLFEL